VSNKTSEQGDVGVDPAETLLYSVFVANSQHTSVGQLAGILGVDLPALARTMSLACRLGFATRVADGAAAGAGGGAKSLGELWPLGAAVAAWRSGSRLVLAEHGAWCCLSLAHVNFCCWLCVQATC
jgi:hypothetical protein